MRLSQLLERVEVRALRADGTLDITGVHYDSRRIRPGNVFVAIRGEQTDGNQFVASAQKNGAVAVISELPPTSALPWVQVTNARRALATVSANFFGYPAERLKLIGITGTNGKTTTSFLCKSILETAGMRSGLVGTIEYRIGDQVIESPHTTPESYDLQQLFAQMLEAGCSAAVMEVSSHALAMDRVWTCPFAAAVFTNLTQDHLDFHGTMEAYLAAKKRLFDGTGAGQPGAAIVNSDDPACGAIVEGYKGRILRYGITHSAELRATQTENTPAGLNFHLRGPGNWETQVTSPLLGRVNVLNILAAIGSGLALGIQRELVLKGVRRVERVPGRFERVYEGQPFTVVVDYAHTPDALNNVLMLARELVNSQTRAAKAPGRVISLFGCGGDRDRTKRPIMGEIAGKRSEVVVLTSDNPRSEDPLLIINDALVGLQRTTAQRFVEPDRRAAIHIAMSEARPGDIVVLAGKGHETYQVVGTEKVPFNEVEEARQALRQL